ncbi:Dual specificity protein phosphatase 23-like [Homarus americanus]|uniref:Dual specificity protein phosphatase 23-like n=1 Tax=Homarus americanus TaxID=6706 RepID=A0A8J5MM39_HOMAM|nr:Dual specificity protein phosphatase 23-like [Homarus americanus]
MSKDSVEYISPPWNFSWVVKKEICASARPQTEANVAFLRNEGVDVLVTLSGETMPHHTAHEYFQCHLLHVEEFEDPSMEQINEFISICDKAREEKKAPDEATWNVRLMRPYSIETWEQERAVKKFRDFLAWGHL